MTAPEAPPAADSRLAALTAATVDSPPGATVDPPPGAGWRRLVLMASLVATLAVAASQLPLQELAQQVNPMAGVTIAAFLLCALVPRTVISLLCGVLFGVTAGAGAAIIAALTAALITYALGRWAGRALLEARAGARLRRLDGWLARRGLLAVIVVRLLPIAPYGLVGYAYGASSVRFGHYFAGTAIGATPSAISYATIGAAASSPASMSWLTFLPAAVGILISTAAALTWRRQATRAATTKRVNIPVRAD